MAPTGNWVHPSGVRLDDECVVSSPPPGTDALAREIQDYPPFVDLDDPVFGVTRRGGSSPVEIRLPRNLY